MKYRICSEHYKNGTIMYFVEKRVLFFFWKRIKGAFSSYFGASSYIKRYTIVKKEYNYIND